MKNGYDQFFKNARQAAEQGGRGGQMQKRSAPTRLSVEISEDEIEKRLRAKAGIKPAPARAKKKSTFPWKMVLFSGIGLVAAVWGFENHEQVDKMISRLEVSYLGAAVAENEPAKETPKAAPAASPAAEAASTAKASDMSSAEIDHLTKLNDRKKELDAREEELNRMESELQVQKLELEKRMKELEEMRTKISSVLDDRVKLDDGKIDTLVQMYSNMKAPQAAKIFETMDEDLAVEILGRMKKKNAADIMNLLKPEKAQVFSEKYAGYKRR